MWVVNASGLSQNLVELENYVRNSHSLFVTPLTTLRNEGRDTNSMELRTKDLVNGPHHEEGD
jgi:hypothetical protein